MGLLIFYLSLALIVSFTCSVMEAVLLATPTSFLEVVKYEIKSDKSHHGLSNKNRRKLKRAFLFFHLKKNIDRPLSAILSLNTIAHTVGAAGVGAQSAVVFGDAYLGLTSGVLTLLILVFSEIIPKSIGAKYWKKIALFLAYPIRTFEIIAFPLVYISEGITSLVTRGKNEESVSREEVAAIVNMGSKEGLFVDEELKSIQGALGLSDLKVRNIMTPRTMAVTASEDMLLKDFYHHKNYLKYSRIPLYKDDNPDEITGFILLKNAFEKLAEDQFDMPLKEIKREITVAFESQKVLSLWATLQKKHKKGLIALVVDEYGSFVGLVTMEDIVETMLGQEIVDEKDTITDLQEYARKRWKKQQTQNNL